MVDLPKRLEGKPKVHAIISEEQIPMPQGHFQT